MTKLCVSFFSSDPTNSLHSGLMTNHATPFVVSEASGKLSRQDFDRFSNS